VRAEHDDYGDADDSVNRLSFKVTTEVISMTPTVTVLPRAYRSSPTVLRSQWTWTATPGGCLGGRGTSWWPALLLRC